MSRRGAAAILTLTLAGGLLAGGPADLATADAPGEVAAVATFPGVNDRIAYTKVWYVSGTPRSDIFSVRPDGDGNKRLSFHRDASAPLWSPSGRRIAYERPDEVWTMRSDGARVEKATDGELVGWMPDGSQLLVVRDLDAPAGTDPTFVLHTLATGEEQELPIDLPLVAEPDKPYDDSEWSSVAHPTLSPDGQRIALMLLRPDEGDGGLEHDFGSYFTVRLDGTGLAKVGTRYTYDMGAPGWSPDSAQLVHSTGEPQSACDGELRSVLLDGSTGPVAVDEPCRPTDPEWSPDGRKVVFVADDQVLRISNLSGSRIKNVLHRKPSVLLSEPDWRRRPPAPVDATAPSRVSATFPGVNDRIAYTKVWYVTGTPGPDRRSEIYSVRPNGDGHKRLTRHQDASSPQWSPSGRRIAYERPDEVWTMRADGAQQELATAGRLVGWMPDGLSLVVVRGLDAPAGTDPTWVVHDIATGEEEELPIDLPLVPDQEPPYDDYSEWSYAAYPTLSPDGELLALMLLRPGYGDDGYSYDLGSYFTVRLDGTALTRIGRYSYSIGGPSWAPDGSQLVYSGGEPRSSCDGSLSSILLDGTAGPVAIDSPPCKPIGPAWSPDGRKIVFASANLRIMIANVNGTRARTVVPSVAGVYRYEPDWRRKPDVAP